MPSKIHVYTDGTVNPKSGIGAYAAVFISLDNGKETRRETIAERKDNTNIQRMELLAVVKALQYIREKYSFMPSVTVFTDSKYVTNGIDSIRRWECNGWRNRCNKTVQNLKLWRRLITFISESGAKVKWIKGHSGNEGNNLAHRVAKIERLR
jgi:ribonuclease HI